jgi:NAD(P) transhydrogenase subunit alpha
MRVGVARETFPGENRVALTPAAVAALVKSKVEVHLEAGAGLAAGFPDAEYESKGAKIVADRAAVLSEADLIWQVRTYGANPAGKDDLAHFRKGQTILGFADPLSAGEAIRALAETGVSLLAVELIPRITRAQAMDALSSQANLAGYKAVLLGAQLLPRVLPMMTTAAGTIQPARVFVLGAGVAGLQAIATARRLGAVVHAFDVRPAVKEQVLSLGAKFVELPLEQDGEDRGGYAREQSAEQQRRQAELLAKTLVEMDLVITTAAVPGKKSPVLIPAEVVANMKRGSVIIDLAAERGGNCALTEADRTVVKHGVTIVGATNLPSMVAYHASLTYATNLLKLTQHLLNKEGQLVFDTSDEITAGALVCRDGEIVQPQVRQILGLPPLPVVAPSPVADVPAAATN